VLYAVNDKWMTRRIIFLLFLVVKLHVLELAGNFVSMLNYVLTGFSGTQLFQTLYLEEDYLLSFIVLKYPASLWNTPLIIHLRNETSHLFCL